MTTPEALFDQNGRMRIMDGMRYYKKTDKENNMPRFVITLDEVVDRNCLQYAAELAMKRFCVQRLTVVQDEERFYLKKNHKKPVVHQEDGSQHTVCTDENNGHMTWIGFDGCDIIVEFFHGVSDGRGMLPFLELLIRAYCQKKHQTDDDLSALIETDENPLECMEGVRFIQQAEAQRLPGYSWQSALVLSGTHLDNESACHLYDLTVEAAPFEAYMRQNGSSRSGLFASFMNHAIAGRHRVDEKPIVAALAVDARRACGADPTMQCCVATVPVWLDKDVLALPMNERLKMARQMIVDGTQKENILASVLGSMHFTERLEAQHPSLEAKKAYCRQITKGDNNRYTYGISYVGEVRFGEAADEHVRAFRTVLCANTIPVIIEITKFKAHYHISYCTHFEDDGYLDAFRQMFLDAGIPCKCQYKGIYTETLAVF